MIIQSTNVLINDEFKKAQIEIKDKKISAIFEYNEKKVDYDFNDEYILPGFYDIHTHGYGGYDTNDATREGLLKWCKEIVKEGVCGIYPTTITQSHEVLSNALKNIANVSNEEYEGARILGIHFEGPYLDKDHKGAQPEEYCIKPNIDELKEYIKDSNNLINIITLACEHDDNYEMVKYCKEHNINVSLGHSGASYKEAKEAIQNGAKGFTHTFNGMSKFNHHNSGLVDAALLIDDAYSEIICDGYHVNIEALKIFFRCKPIDKAIMISDALRAKNLPVGTIMEFGGQQIQIEENGTCIICGTNTLAGSTLKINKGIKLLVEEVGLDLKDAIKTASTNPAKYLDLNKGIIQQGYDGDIVVMNKDYDILMTIVEGDIAYKNY